jgi:hypothetical protein
MRILNLKDQGVFYSPEPDDGCYGKGYSAWNILLSDNIEDITHAHRQGIVVNSDSFPDQTLILPLAADKDNNEPIPGMFSYPCIFFNNGRNFDVKTYTCIKDLSVYTCDYHVNQVGTHVLTLCLGVMMKGQVTERVYIRLGNPAHLARITKAYYERFAKSKPLFWAAVYPDYNFDPPCIYIQPINHRWSLFHESFKTIKKCFGKGYLKPLALQRGKIDVLEILRYLVKIGWISEDAYVPYTQFGAMASHGPLPVDGHLSIMHLDIQCK